MNFKARDLSIHYDALKDPNGAWQSGRVYGMTGSNFSPHEWAEMSIEAELARLERITRYLANKDSPPAGYSWSLQKDGDGLIEDVTTQLDFVTWEPNELHPGYIKEFEQENIKFSSYDPKEGFKIWYSYVNKPSLTSLFKMAYGFKVNDLFKDVTLCQSPDYVTE